MDEELIRICTAYPSSLEVFQHGPAYPEAYFKELDKCDCFVLNHAMFRGRVDTPLLERYRTKPIFLVDTYVDHMAENELARLFRTSAELARHALLNFKGKHVVLYNREVQLQVIRYAEATESLRKVTEGLINIEGKARLFGKD